jgi:RNA ligase
MKDPILLNKMWREVEAGRVISNQSGSLTLFKYTQKTIIDDLWNDVNRQARGIIFDLDGRVVARPFNKFFNMNEREETKAANLPWLDGFEIFEKLDGSCGTGYIGDSQWKLATPGSMESDQAVEGTAILHSYKEPETIDLDDGSVLVALSHNVKRYDLSHLPVDCTPIFEIIYPENRIVVDYHGSRELVLLAIFEHNGEEWHPRRVDQIAQMCGFRRPKEYRMDLREATFEDNTEGYVCRFDCGLRVKVKSPTYTRIHRLLDAMSPKGVIALIRGREYGVTVKQLPASIACDFDDIRALVQGMYDKIFTDAHANLNRMLECQGENTPRKQQALWIQENVDNMEGGFVFALLDGKEIEDKIWKLVTERIKDEPNPED